jgi:hypothetical protein
MRSAVRRACARPIYAAKSRKNTAFIVESQIGQLGIGR